MARIVDRMRALPGSEVNDQARRMADARKSMQMRLKVGFLHEAMNVVEVMQRLPMF